MTCVYAAGRDVAGSLGLDGEEQVEGNSDPVGGTQRDFVVAHIAEAHDRGHTPTRDQILAIIRKRNTEQG